MSPENITQIIIALIVALGGVTTARITASRKPSDAKLVQSLKHDLEDCERERQKQAAFYFAELARLNRLLKARK